jgi:hypothetical protein
MLLVGAFLYNKHKDSSEDAAYQNLQTVTITDEGNNAQKMLLVTFEIGNAADSIKLKSIDQYNSHADVPDVRENQYNLSVTEEGSPVYLTYFDIPVTIVEDFSESGEIKMVAIAKEKKLAFRTPRFSDGSVFMIRDKTGKVLLRDTIKNVVVHENTTEFNTLIADPRE